MSSLSYITRASSSPRGKPRVWLCCHPADQARFLEPLAKDLLAAADCAFWYDPDPAAPLSDEEQAGREADLSDMQLFLLPVTRKLLLRSCRARERELPFALQRHIPVLPILKEPGLAALFNKTCGDLQCLDPSGADPTSPPWDEKLKKYLDGVLVGDELAAKVRAAFDGRIFLSYRKTDRLPAQALMRLIHQTTACRDMAIWYDEFLTPGEGFNAAIAQALDESQLFLMAVTPRLLEPGNYVMTHEFPQAMKAGKPILPVEMVPTDRPALEKAYPGIPPCAAPDPLALVGRLGPCLRGLPLGKRAGQPDHDLLIGLAYLSGIDVEVDKARGVGLLRGAARAGLPEAMEKMAAVYRTGEGVARDRRAAIQWQEKLVDARRAAWERAPDANSFLRYANPLWALADDYAALEDDANAADIWEQEFLPLCQEADARGLAPAARYLSVAYARSAQLLRRQGERETALRLLLKAVELRLRLVKKKADRQTVQDLFLSIDAVGLFHLENGDLPAARGWFEKSLGLLAPAGGMDRCLGREDAALLYTRMGALCQKEGDPDAACRWFEKALDLRRRLAEEKPGLKTGLDLSALCQKLGLLCLSRRRDDEAHRWFGEDLTLLQAMAEKDDSAPLRRRLADAYSLMGESSRRRDTAAARGWYQKSLELRRQLARELGSDQALHALALALLHLGALPGEDAALLRESFDLLSRLAREHPAVALYARDMSRAWDELLRREAERG